MSIRFIKTDGAIEPVSGDAIAMEYSCSVYGQGVNGTQEIDAIDPTATGATGWGATNGILSFFGEEDHPYSRDPSGMLAGNETDIIIQRTGLYLVQAKFLWESTGDSTMALRAYMNNSNTGLSTVLLGQATGVSFNGTLSGVSLSFVHQFYETPPYDTLWFRACVDAGSGPATITDVQAHVRFLAGM